MRALTRAIVALQSKFNGSTQPLSRTSKHQLQSASFSGTEKPVGLLTALVVVVFIYSLVSWVVRCYKFCASRAARSRTPPQSPSISAKARVRVRSRPSNRRTRPILSNQYAQWTIKRRLFGDDYPILAVTTHPSMPAPIKRAMSGVDVRCVTMVKKWVPARIVAAHSAFAPARSIPLDGANLTMAAAPRDALAWSRRLAHQVGLHSASAAHGTLAQDGRLEHRSGRSNILAILARITLKARFNIAPPRTATWLTEMAFFPEAAIVSKEALERKDAAIIFGRAEKWNKHENGLRTLAWRPSSTCRELLPLVFQTTKPVEVFRGITRDIPAGKRRKRNSDQDYKSSRIQA
uniref:Uncharacterized protein n=1 Tax=Macrostomum lignano TaxID=282301 RepID=A0A1I8GD85_9PLAT